MTATAYSDVDLPEPPAGAALASSSFVNIGERTNVTGSAWFKKLVMAGLWTEVCLAYTVLSARADGYEVYFVEDASAGVSEAAHRMAVQRMILCGAQPVNWVGLMSEWNRSVAPQRAGAVMAMVGEIALTHAQNIGQRYAYGMQLAPEKLGARPQPVLEL